MIGPLVPFNTMVHIVVSVLLHFCSGRELKFGHLVCVYLQTA